MAIYGNDRCFQICCLSFSWFQARIRFNPNGNTYMKRNRPGRPTGSSPYYPVGTEIQTKGVTVTLSRQEWEALESVGGYAPGIRKAVRLLPEVKPAGNGDTATVLEIFNVSARILGETNPRKRIELQRRILELCSSLSA